MFLTFPTQHINEEQHFCETLMGRVFIHHVSFQFARHYSPTSQSTGNLVHVESVLSQPEEIPIILQ